MMTDKLDQLADANVLDLSAAEFREKLGKWKLTVVVVLHVRGKHHGVDRLEAQVCK